MKRMIHFKKFTFGRPEIVLFASLVAVTILAVIIGHVPAITHRFEVLNHAWTAWALRVGYFGAFASALIGSLSIGIILPYTVIIFFLATQGLDPFLLGLLMGTGAAIGQMSGYVIGRWGARPFQRARPEEYEALERIINFRPWFTQWIIFLFGATPLPDVVINVPLGMLRYPVWKIALATWLGKVAAGMMVTYSGSLVLHFFTADATTTTGTLISELVTFYSLALVVYFMVKIDWLPTMHRLIDHHAPASASSTNTTTV